MPVRPLAVLCVMSVFGRNCIAAPGRAEVALAPPETNGRLADTLTQLSGASRASGRARFIPITLVRS